MAVLHDITPLLTADLAVWPGDTAVSREVLLSQASGDSVTLSTLRATVHLGAHADAPLHYDPVGRAIDAQPLDVYLGRCQVMHVPVERGSRVRVADLTAAIASPRLLLGTGTYPDPHTFTPDFAGLDAELVSWLASRGVRLIGVDTPSIDVCSSTDLPAHAACRAHDIAILEGLVLADVKPGLYDLVALPLKLHGFDASPIRAILRRCAGSPR